MTKNIVGATDISPVRQRCGLRSILFGKLGPVRLGPMGLGQFPGEPGQYD